MKKCNLKKIAILKLIAVLIEMFCLRISILKDQKEQQNQHLIKLHRISDELRQKAVALGEKLVDTSEMHMELLKR